MRKKFILIVLAILLAIVAIIFLILNITKKLSDTYVDDNGITIATIKDKERIQKLLDKDKKIKFDFSKISNISNIDFESEVEHEYVEIDGKNMVCVNTSFNIASSEIYLKNLSIENTDKEKTVFTINGDNPTIILENISIKGCKSSTAFLIKSQNATIKVIGNISLIAGDGEVTKDGGIAFIANSVTFSGNGYLFIQGGKAGRGIDGADGVDGKSYNTSATQATTMFTEGRDGKNGGNGSNGSDGQASGVGGDAMSAKSIFVTETVQLKCCGGDSSHSGKGGDSGSGGNGEGAIKGNPWQLTSHYGGDGGNSGSSGNGSDEKRPGFGIICDYIMIDSSASVKATHGEKGEAGKAGEVATPGKGGESFGSFSDWDGKGKSGSTGSYGRKGIDGQSLSESEIVDFLITSIDGIIN